MTPSDTSAWSWIRFRELAPAVHMRREPKSELTPPGVELRGAGPNVEVVVGGKPLTEYRTDEGPKPYYFPVIGPTGPPSRGPTR